MTDLTPDDMAAKLQAAGFAHTGPDTAALTDPIADTPMVVTLDQLRPYELNPRVTRNPLYDDIKASIRERGLDAPPVITRRPGQAHYIIRNGGNTRLAILAELWAETRDERFYRIPCLFRPWSARGEIVALTGHLAENELHGHLTFIERALAVDKARQLYEQESGASMSQSELARRLTRDGYPITQPHISRMQDAVRYLLPAIPSLLYGGLGKPQIERLAAVRRAAARAWELHTQDKARTDEFAALFQDVVSLFDGDFATFCVQRIHDELIGQMADQLGVDYDVLILDVEEAEVRQRALTREPSTAADTTDAIGSRKASPSPLPDTTPNASTPQPRTAEPTSSPSQTLASDDHRDEQPGPAERTETPGEEYLQRHVVSPARDTERLQAVRQLVAEHTGDTAPDFATTVVQAVPVQAGGLHPVADVWYIAPTLDDPAPLRTHIAQLAREIAAEADMDATIASVDSGIGYRVDDAAGHHATPLPFLARAVRGLFTALTVAFADPPSSSDSASLRLADDIAPLLLGGALARPLTRLSDAALVKLYRLLRLARRLHDHTTDTTGASDTADDTHGAP